MQKILTLLEVLLVILLFILIVLLFGTFVSSAQAQSINYREWLLEYEQVGTLEPTALYMSGYPVPLTVTTPIPTDISGYPAPVSKLTAIDTSGYPAPNPEPVKVQTIRGEFLSQDGKEGYSFGAPYPYIEEKIENGVTYYLIDPMGTYKVWIRKIGDY